MLVRTVVADSHHFKEEPGPLQSVTAVLEPHQSEKPDPESDADPKHRERKPYHCQKHGLIITKRYGSL
jgi:hypothetical protein